MSTADAQTIALNYLPLLSTPAISGGCVIALIFLIRYLDQLNRDSERLTYRLDFPSNFNLEHVTAFVRSLTGRRSHRGQLLGHHSLAFETVRRTGSSDYLLRIPRGQTDHVLTQLAASLPGIRVTKVAEPADVQRFSQAAELRLSSTLAIRTDIADSFSTCLLHTLTEVTDREAAVYQLVVYSLGTPRSLPAVPRSSSIAWPQWLHLFTQGRWLAQPTRPTPAQLREKLSEPLFGVTLRVGGAAAYRSRSRQLVSRIASIVHQLDRPNATFVRRSLPQRVIACRLRRATTPITSAPLHLNARELATLLAWPIGSPVVPGLQLAGGRVFPPSTQLPTTGRIYGHATYPGHERPVAVSASDARMHTLILGPTGSGKSTEMLGLIAQDLAVGRGLVLIDPNVSLANAAIDLIPKHRAGDLIYLNPADERPIGLDPLECPQEDAELAADQVLELIRDQSISWGVGLEELLRNTLVLLAATPGMTLTEVPAVLRDDHFRTSLLSRLEPAFHPTVGEFFASFAARSLAQRTQDTAAVLNKVSPLLDRRPIRSLLGQDRATWSMRQVLDERKILIVALPSGVISPQAANLIGSMVVRLVWNTALARSAMPPGQRRPITLYLDELARFVGRGSDLADLLARARALGLDLVGALQHLGQAPAKLQAALLSEARNKVILQPAADDASLLARHLVGVRPEDLLSLKPRTAMASLVANGHLATPVTIATLAPPASTGGGDTARAASRLRYGRDRKDVEAQILARRLTGHDDTPRRTRRAV